MIGQGAASIAWTLFAATLITRIPFQTERLWAWDSVLYARAVERFDPSAQQPQAPGYLYYVLLARALEYFVGDATRALVLISAVAAAAAVGLLYLLGRRLYDERTGRLASLFLLTAVTFWAYGAIAYPYTLLGALAVAVALLLWERRLLLGSAAWGIAIGFRPDLLLFSAPLWILTAWRARPATVLGGAAIVGGLIVLWLVASAAAAGSLERFLDAIDRQGDYVDRKHSVFALGAHGLFANAYELARYLGRALYVLAFPLLALALLPGALHGELSHRRRALFLALWIAAPLSVYLLIHVGDYGYVFSFLPALALLAARGTLELARRLRAFVVPITARRVGLGIVMMNAGIFLLTDTPLSATDLERRDDGVAEKAAFVRAHERPDTVVVSSYDFVLVEHYLADTEVALLRIDPLAGARVHRPAGCDLVARCFVIVWDELLRVEGERWQAIVLPSGARLRVSSASNLEAIATDGSNVRLHEADLAAGSTRAPPQRRRPR